MGWGEGHDIVGCIMTGAKAWLAGSRYNQLYRDMGRPGHWESCIAIHELYRDKWTV